MPFLDTLFSFRGRVGRAGWWMTGLAQTAILIVLFAVQAVTLAGAPRGGGDPAALSVIGLWLVGLGVFAWIGLAATVRRWHDRDKSALWILIGMIPVIGPLWTIVELGFLPGTVGGNRFGPPTGSGIGDWADTEAGFDPDAVVSSWKAAAAASAPTPSRAGDPWAARPPVIARTSSPGGGFGRRGLK